MPTLCLDSMQENSIKIMLDALPPILNLQKAKTEDTVCLLRKMTADLFGYASHIKEC